MPGMHLIWLGGVMFCSGPAASSFAAWSRDLFCAARLVLSSSSAPSIASPCTAVNGEVTQSTEGIWAPMRSSSSLTPPCAAEAPCAMTFAKTAASAAPNAVAGAAPSIRADMRWVSEVTLAVPLLAGVADTRVAPPPSALSRHGACAPAISTEKRPVASVLPRPLPAAHFTSTGAFTSGAPMAAVPSMRETGVPGPLSFPPPPPQDATSSATAPSISVFRMPTSLSRLPSDTATPTPSAPQAHRLAQSAPVLPGRRNYAVSTG